MRSKLKCPFTNNEINLGTYIKIHSKFNLSKNEFKFKILYHNFGDIVSFDNFKLFYIDKTYSLPDFKKEFNINYNNTLWLIDYHNLEKRNIKNAINTDKKIQKSKITCINRYGVENVSQNEKVKEKKRQTFKKNYGVDNIRKSKNFYIWLNEYMLQKYGKKRITQSSDKCSVMRKKWWSSLTKEEKDIKINKQLINIHSGSCSKLELNFKKYLNLLQIDFKHNFYIGNNQFDFKILKTNILIEVNGDFWHANPSQYCENDTLLHPSTNGIKASDIWKKDQKKLDLAKSKGYHVVTIWENFLKNSSEKEILEKIYNEIKINKKNTEQI
jgi:G:T-mismatch repair DNA endonuclease (very short patch repair protein)